MEDNEPIIEQEVVTTPVVTTIKPINIYAVFGISILTTALAGGVIGLTAFIISSTESYYNEYSSLVAIACFVLVAALALGIPVLAGMKFGWRTVVTTILIEAILLFVVASGFAIFGPTEDQPDFSDRIYDGASITD